MLYLSYGSKDMKCSICGKEIEVEGALYYCSKKCALQGKKIDDLLKLFKEGK
jgi:endogenous inhibitor of DNA gyrase (YacG/DUF329 family)